MKKLNIIIPNRMLGSRLDVSLSEMLPDYSRSKITAWIKSGDALINQKNFKPKDKSSGNEIVCLTLNLKQNDEKYINNSKHCRELQQIIEKRLC